MSRIGNAPITVPASAKVAIEPGLLRVSGPKGELTSPIPDGIELKLEEGQLIALRKHDQHAALHGLARSLAQNAVTGVTEGFAKELEIVGVGYRVALQGRVAVFQLGYSHPIEVVMPDGVDIAVDQNKVRVSGADKQQVGQVAAMIRSLRKPDPYKQKGVRYLGEQLRKKEGKTGAS
jgi:large subunit ribosomal protein L6